MYDYLLIIAFLHKSHEDQTSNNKIQLEKSHFQYFLEINIIFNPSFSIKLSLKSEHGEIARAILKILPVETSKISYWASLLVIFSKLS